jgi:hypothetical protein
MLFFATAMSRSPEQPPPGALANQSFEFPLRTTFEYRPLGYGWVFSGNAGIQRNASAWGAANAPYGVQTGFLQGSDASVRQAVTRAAGTYVVTFHAARRAGQLQPLQLFVNDRAIGTPITPTSNLFTAYQTASFTVENGTHQIEIRATASGDNTSFIDNVAMVAQTRKRLSALKAEQMQLNNGGVFVSVFDEVEIDEDIDLSWLEIQGKVFCTNRDVSLSARWVMVHGGHLQCGTEIAPHGHRLTVTLTGTNPTDSALGAGMGTKVLGVMHGGKLDLHGQRKRAWTKLAATAQIGATQISLFDEPTGWQIGDVIVVAATGADPLAAEKRTITGINGAIVKFAEPLLHAHWGGAPQSIAGHTLDMRAEVGNISRSIVVTSSQNEDRLLPGFDPESSNALGQQNGDGKRLEVGRFGGHMMFMTGSSVKLSNIEVTQMGQQGMLGRYPVHWHLTQDTSAGSYIKHSSVHSNFQRGIVLHQANSVGVDSNVIYDIPGHAVFLEDGVEKNNTFRNNLVLSVKYVLRKHRLSLKDPGNENENRAERQAGFWITNPENTFANNVVAGVENGWGYIFADVRSDKIPVVSRTQQQFAENSRLLEFKDNVAHSIGFLPGTIDGGKSVFNLGYGPEEAGSCFRFDQRGIIDARAAEVIGAVAYKCRNAAFWSSNFKPIKRAVIADSRTGVINNQGELPASMLDDSLIIAHSANNAVPSPSLDFGPFPGPVLFEAPESGPVLLSNVVSVGAFKDSDNSTPELNGITPETAATFAFRPFQPVFLRANAAVSVPITIERLNGYAGPVSLTVAIPKRPNLSADNPYFYVTSDPITIPAGETSAVLTLRNLSHPKPGERGIILVGTGRETVTQTLDVFTATAPQTFNDPIFGKNVARLFANTASPRNPALAQMEFNRGGTFAVDGNLSSYAHTGGTPLPWFQIDLEKSYRLAEIRLKGSTSVTFGDVWVFTSDFPIFDREMTLQEALSLPNSLVSRYEVVGSVGLQTTIALPAGTSARVVRIWGKQAGEMKIPEVEIISE